MSYFLHQMYDLPKRTFIVWNSKIKSNKGRLVDLTFGFTFRDVVEVDGGVVRAFISDTEYILLSVWDLGIQDKDGFNPLGYKLPIYTGHNR